MNAFSEKVRGYVFASATMAYGSPCLPPPPHKLCLKYSPGWELVVTMPHDAGVTVVWRTAIAMDPAENWPGTGGG